MARILLKPGPRYPGIRVWVRGGIEVGKRGPGRSLQSGVTPPPSLDPQWLPESPSVGSLGSEHSHLLGSQLLCWGLLKCGSDVNEAGPRVFI